MRVVDFTLSAALPAAIPVWMLALPLGVLGVLFILILLRGGRQGAEERILPSDMDLPVGAFRGYSLALLDAGRLREADASLQAHLARVPSDIRMRGLLGMLCATEGNHAAAAEEYEHALRVAEHTWEPGTAPHMAPFIACLNAAYALELRALGRPQEAEARFQEALRLDMTLGQQSGRFSRLLLELARDDELERRAFEDLVEWEHGRPIAMPFGLTDASEAVRFFRHAVRTRPNEARPHGDLAQALHAVGDHRAAEREFQEALRLDAPDPWLHFQYGLMFWRREQLADAERELREAARLAPRRAAIRGTLGVFCLRQGRYPEAEQELVAALSARPDVWVLARVFGTASLQQGNLRQAARAFEEAERLGANDAPFRLVYAELRERLGDPRAAEEQYRAAMRLDTTTAEARASYGGFLLRQGRLHESEQVLGQALLLPGNGAAHLHLTGLLLLERRLDEVPDHLQAALTYDPQSSLAREYQAEYQILHGHPEEGEELLRPLLRAGEARASLQLVRAEALLALNRELEATTALREAMRLDPTSPDRLFAQANGLRALGGYRAALEILSQALALRPEWPEAIAVRDELVREQAAARPPATHTMGLRRPRHV